MTREDLMQAATLRIARGEPLDARVKIAWHFSTRKRTWFPFLLARPSTLSPSFTLFEVSEGFFNEGGSAR